MARILIADDNADYAGLISELIKQEGHEVMVASNGREAISMLREGDFNLVITDLLMPEVDGFGVIRFVHEMEKKIPIIALSGGGVTVGSAEALRTIEDFVELILEKPINLDILIGKIKALL